MTDSLLKLESGYAHELREACDKNGIEVDYQKSAQALLKLGQVYRKQTPDRIAMIKSVGLFNAAILRKPFNINEIKQELSSFCSEILLLADAVDQNADLVKQAEKIKGLIREMRSSTHQAISQSLIRKRTKTNQNTKEEENKKIKHVMEIQEKISVKFKNIMASIAEYCTSVLGEPPCKFCIAGMGSLARVEATPYSDFEHIILLEDRENNYGYNIDLEYFRWYSVIFHVIVLNLQETIVPNLNITSLKNSVSDFRSWFFDTCTPCGISFDGMVPHACKFPLGRQQCTDNKPFNNELIHSVSSMLQYLTSEEDLKNGYHLKDVLTKTCFVFGDSYVYQDFESGVKNFYEKQSHDAVLADIKDQVKEDLDNFATRLKLKGLKSTEMFNVKKTVYRSSTLFVSALGRMHKVRSQSCFKIIDSLTEKGIFTENARHKLMLAVAIACEIRLKLYMSENAQCDFVVLPRDMKKFLDFAGRKQTRNYFQIVYCLQAEISKQLNFLPDHFYCFPELINITICHALQMEAILNRLVSNYDIFGDFSDDTLQFNFDGCLKKLENHLESSVYYDNSDFKYHHIFSIFFHLFIIGFFLFNLERYNEAQEFFRRFLDTYKNKNLGLETQLQDNGVSFIMLQRIFKQLQKRAITDGSNTISKRFLEIHLQRKSENVIATMFEFSAFCLFTINQFKESIKLDKEALLLYKSVSVDKDMDLNVARALENIGLSQEKLGQFSASLHNYERALKIHIGTSADFSENVNVARLMEKAGTNNLKLEQYNLSLHLYSIALGIYKNTASDSSRDENIARLNKNIGLLEHV